MLVGLFRATRISYVIQYKYIYILQTPRGERKRVLILNVNGNTIGNVDADRIVLERFRNHRPNATIY